MSHHLGRDEAKRRLDAGMGHVRAQLAPLVSSLSYAWDGYRLDFDIAALRAARNRDDPCRRRRDCVEIGLPLRAGPGAGHKVRFGLNSDIGLVPGAGDALLTFSHEIGKGRGQMFDFSPATRPANITRCSIAQPQRRRRDRVETRKHQRWQYHWLV